MPAPACLRHDVGFRHASQGLKSRVVTGFKWNLVGKGLQRLLSLGAMVILARRLDPPTFGLFALAFVAIDGLPIFQNLGLTSALVQRRELPARAAHTAFVLLVAASLSLAALSYTAAPLCWEGSTRTMLWSAS